jgi:hypothetical protein
MEEEKKKKKLMGQSKDNKPTQNIFQIMDEIGHILPLPMIYSVRVPNCWWTSNNNDVQ